MIYRKLIYILVLFICQINTSCTNSDNTKFELTGNLTGITDGKIILSKVEEPNIVSDTTLITKGKFILTKDIPEPDIYKLEIIGYDAPIYFFAENTRMSITANADSLYLAQITGGSTNSDEKRYRSELNSISQKYRQKYAVDSLLNEFVKTKNVEYKKILDNHFAELRKIVDEFALNFIKQNPASYYSAYLIELSSEGKSIAQIEESLLLLDVSLNESAIVKRVKEKIINLQKTEVTMENFIPNAHNLTYAVDKTYKGADHKNVIYLAVMSNDNVCALTAEGNILVINPAGDKVTEFKSNLTSKPAVIAVDKADNIYVLGGKSEEKTVEVRGKSVKQNTPVGVECLVLNSKGAKVREIALEGVITATGVRVSEDNILVADTRSRLINIYNVETGKKKATIGNLRTCCGILDFGVRNNNEVLVANLGAFRVNGFDYAGNATISFGERGTDLNQFHGCCNPVSVAFLSNGGIVTVEKDPTRIKVYSNEGAKKIEGIDELVKGCVYIPMIVDTKDNVYLASKADGLVKCIPTK